MEYIDLFHNLPVYFSASFSDIHFFLDPDEWLWISWSDWNLFWTAFSLYIILIWSNLSCLRYSEWISLYTKSCQLPEFPYMIDSLIFVSALVTLTVAIFYCFQFILDLVKVVLIELPGLLFIGIRFLFSRVLFVITLFLLKSHSLISWNIHFWFLILKIFFLNLFFSQFCSKFLVAFIFYHLAQWRPDAFSKRKAVENISFLIPFHIQPFNNSLISLNIFI